MITALKKKCLMFCTTPRGKAVLQRQLTLTPVASESYKLQILTFSWSISCSKMVAFLLASAACLSLASMITSIHLWHFFRLSCKNRDFHV